MTLLSLFMTSAGVFCFVPISHRLVESGITPASDGWRFRRLPFVLVPTPHAIREGKARFLPSDDKGKDARSEQIQRHYMQHSPLQIPPCFADHALFDTCPKLTVSHTEEWTADIIPPSVRSPTGSFLTSPSIDTLDGRESTSLASFTQDSTLCDSCSTLLRGEIPPDHIPSVVRAFALFEAQDRLSDIVFNECEVAALTNAFSMLRL